MKSLAIEVLLPSLALLCGIGLVLSACIGSRWVAVGLGSSILLAGVITLVLQERRR